MATAEERNSPFCLNPPPPDSRITDLETATDNASGQGTSSLMTLIPFVHPIPVSGDLIPSEPHAPDSAPVLPPSQPAEAPKPKNKKKKPSKTTKIHLDLDDLFGVNSEKWTRFFAVEPPNQDILDNMDIWDDLKDKLQDEFEYIRRKDGSILIDAITERNAKVLEKLTKINDNDVTTTRDTQLNSVRGTILVPPSEFSVKSGNLEARLLKTP